MTPELDQKVNSIQSTHQEKLIEQWYIFSPTGGTTHRGFTIQFRLVPGVNFSFFNQKIVAIFALSVETSPKLFSLKTITKSSQ